MKTSKSIVKKSSCIFYDESTGKCKALKVRNCRECKFYKKHNDPRELYYQDHFNRGVIINA